MPTDWLCVQVGYRSQPGQGLHTDLEPLFGQCHCTRYALTGLSATPGPGQPLVLGQAGRTVTAPGSDALCQGERGCQSPCPGACLHLPDQTVPGTGRKGPDLAAVSGCQGRRDVPPALQCEGAAIPGKAAWSLPGP